jgi:hypothetical protein
VTVRVMSLANGEVLCVLGATGSPDAGKDGFSGKSRFTDVFVKRDGRWQAVASHESNLPKG